MSEGSLGQRTVAGYLEELASSSPTPGGGAVGALTAAAGAALIAMVGRLTVGKPAFADLEERLRAMVATADAAVMTLAELADRDAHAFDGVMAAYKMPKGTGPEQAARTAAIQAGLLDAASVPLEVARRAVELMGLAEDATAMGNPQAASDGLSAGAALHAGALCAMANVEINAASLKDKAARAGLLQELEALKRQAEAGLAEVQTAFRLRLPS
jgi:formiminotetrahydrofolate cyclodeaminase